MDGAERLTLRECRNKASLYVHACVWKTQWASELPREWIYFTMRRWEKAAANENMQTAVIKCVLLITKAKMFSRLCEKSKYIRASRTYTSSIKQPPVGRMDGRPAFDMVFAL